MPVRTVSWQRWIWLATTYLTIVFASLALVRWETSPSTSRLGLGAVVSTAAWCVVAVAFGTRRPRLLGGADAVTLLRLAFACAALGGVAMLWDRPQSGVLALLFLVATGLDALDGAVARGRGEASATGARFDVNADSAVLLIVCLAAAPLVGWWVLVLGLLRYAFLLAGMLWPTLRAPLPHRDSRRLIGAVQPLALTLAIVPGVTPPWSTMAAAIALTLLVYSFGRDVVHLIGAPRSS